MQAWDPEFSPVSMGGWSQVWLCVHLGPWHCEGRDRTSPWLVGCQPSWFTERLRLKRIKQGAIKQNIGLQTWNMGSCTRICDTYIHHNTHTHVHTHMNLHPTKILNLKGRLGRSGSNPGSSYISLFQK